MTEKMKQDKHIDKALDEAKLLASEGSRARNQRFLRATTGDYSNSLKFEEGRTTTDGKVAIVDPLSPMMEGMEIVDKMMVLRGQVGTQSFHNLYTNHDVVRRISSKYSDDPSRAKISKNYLSMVEGAAVEFAGGIEFPGTVPYLRTMNEAFKKTIPSMEELEAQDNQLLSHLQATSYYAATGEHLGEFSDPDMQDKYEKSVKLINRSRFASTTQERFVNSEKILSLVKDLVDEAVENGSAEQVINPKGELSETGEGQGKRTPEEGKDWRKISVGEGGEGSEDGESGEGEGANGGSDDSEGKGKIPEDKKENYTNDLDMIPQGVTNPGDYSDSKIDDDDFQERLNAQIRKELEKELADLEADMEREARSAEQSSIRQERVRDHLKNKVAYAKIHQGIQIKDIHKFSDPGQLKHNYQIVKDQINPTTRAMMKRLQNLIRYNQEEKRTGQVSGAITQSQLWRKDGKIFSQKKDKSQEAELVILLLVDESGSMGGMRESSARRAAVMLAEVCEKLNIPLSIVGHTAHFSGPVVELRHFISFEKSIGEQKHHCAEIRAREDNRDGLPIKYCGEYLLQQPQQDKVLLVIADGEPAHSGRQWGESYSGKSAEIDCTFTVDQLEKRGVTSVGIAIGDGQDGIARMFKNFLSVPNLEKLPTKLVKLLEKRIFKEEI